MMPTFAKLNSHSLLHCSAQNMGDLWKRIMEKYPKSEQDTKQTTVECIFKRFQFNCLSYAFNSCSVLPSRLINFAYIFLNIFYSSTFLFFALAVVEHIFFWKCCWYEPHRNNNNYKKTNTIAITWTDKCSATTDKCLC